MLRALQSYPKGPLGPMEAESAALGYGTDGIAFDFEAQAGRKLDSSTKQQRPYDYPRLCYGNASWARARAHSNDPPRRPGCMSMLCPRWSWAAPVCMSHSPLQTRISWMAGCAALLPDARAPLIGRPRTVNRRYPGARKRVGRPVHAHSEREPPRSGT